MVVINVECMPIPGSAHEPASIWRSGLLRAASVGRSGTQPGGGFSGARLGDSATVIDRPVEVTV